MKSTEQKIIKFINYHNLISAGDKILVALSGGPDSVFTLHFFSKFRKRFKITIGAAHINHNLRGKNSDNDEKFCAKICDEAKISFYSEKVDVKTYSVKNKLSIEEAARELRYTSLENILKKNNYDKIITAHTIDDNAETILLNVIKGTGLRGISGIPISRGKIIRPILCVSKSEILQYLEQNKVDYRIDESNKDTKYKRNFIRHKLIPLIKKELNPSLEKNLFTSSQVFKNTQVLIDDYTREIINDSISIKKGSVSIELDAIAKYPVEALGEVLKTIMMECFNREFGYNDFSKIESLFSNKTGTKISLAGNLIAYRERNFIVIQMKQTRPSFRLIKIKINEVVKIDNRSLKLSFKEREEIKLDDNKFHEYISADNLDDTFIVRKWKDGDKFIPLGMKGFKKVSDFLTEQKIPSLEKKEQLVLQNRNNIVWIIGLRIDDRFKINNNTKKVIELCLN